MAKKSETSKISVPKNLRSKNTALIAIVVLAVVLFAVSGWLWWTKSFTDEGRVFDDMLASNLTSTSVARKVVQKDQSSSVDQSVFVNFQAPEVFSQTLTKIGEKGVSRKTTTVTTETIGTQNKDLVRYVSAEGAEELSVAGRLDQVLGVWGERTADPNKGQQAVFLNEAIFSIVPYGNLPKEQRTELLQFIKDKGVYRVVQADRAFIDGRYTYTYSVAIKPEALVETLAKYVELTGIGDITQLDPSGYKNAPEVNVRMQVDIPSRQLLSIDYLATGRSETIESRGLYRELIFPSQTIPFEELNNRLTGRNTTQTQGT